MIWEIFSAHTSHNSWFMWVRSVPSLLSTATVTSWRYDQFQLPFKIRHTWDWRASALCELFWLIYHHRICFWAILSAEIPQTFWRAIWQESNVKNLDIAPSTEVLEWRLLSRHFLLILLSIAPAVTLQNNWAIVYILAISSFKNNKHLLYLLFPSIRLHKYPYSSSRCIPSYIT